MISTMMDSFTQRFRILTNAITADGEGGGTVAWTEGSEFDGCLSRENHYLTHEAEGQRPDITYRLLVPAEISLSYPDVIVRVADGATFQITTDGGDLRTPGSSRLALRAVNARKWRKP